MLAVPMLANGSLEPGLPRVLFERTLARSPSVRPANYDVASDGPKTDILFFSPKSYGSLMVKSF